MAQIKPIGVKPYFHLNTYLVPIALEFRPLKSTWTLRQSKGGDTLHHVPGDFAPTPLDPWDMREDFFRHKRGDVKSLLKFLQKWGAWRSPGDPLSTWNRGPVPKTFRPAEIWDRRDFFLNILRGLPRSERDWLSDPATHIAANTAANAFPYQICFATGCEFAMRFTVTIDIFNKCKFRQCERADCPAVFTSTDSRKKFCTWKCGHLVSVREKRKGVTHAAR
jgi:hypothetical protein